LEVPEKPVDEDDEEEGDEEEGRDKPEIPENEVEPDHVELLATKVHEDKPVNLEQGESPAVQDQSVLPV